MKEFAKAAKGKKIVNFIMPVGPTQPYRLMAEKINYRNRTDGQSAANRHVGVVSAWRFAVFG